MHHMKMQKESNSFFRIWCCQPVTKYAYQTNFSPAIRKKRKTTLHVLEEHTRTQ